MKAKCIAKARGKNNTIIGYKLQDQQGNTTIVKPEALKSAMKSNKIEIINLTLTSDNRLIDTTPKSQQPSLKNRISQEEQKIKLMIEKAKALGVLTEIPTYCNHKCILIGKDSTNHILYIPDDVVQLNGTNINSLTFTKHIQNLQGHIKVIGGHNLENTRRMFSGCEAQSIDLSSFDTSNVTDMSYMFSCCQAQSLDLSSFDTSEVTDMNHMFYGCQAQSIVLYNFNTRNVTDMSYMFKCCKAQSLNLYSFHTYNVTDMSGMFELCETQYLDLPCFDLISATAINKVFKECKAQNK